MKDALKKARRPETKLQVSKVIWKRLWERPVPD